jgi:hypothetical protein
MNIFSIIRRALQPQPPPAAEENRWKIAGCSLPGTGHLRRGRGCEDAVGWFQHAGLLGVAVADGAGSAALAALGSGLAVRTALLTLQDHHLHVCPITANSAKHALVNACRQTIHMLCARAAETAFEPCDLACTLILVVASRNFVFAAQIGDGAVVVKDDDGNLYSLTKPTNGEFANETVLMGCAPTMDVQIGSFAEFRLKSIAVFSDGLQRLALQMPPCEPHEPFFQPLFERLQCLTEPDMDNFLKEFLDSPRVNTRTDDDKSIVTAQVL